MLTQSTRSVVNRQQIFNEMRSRRARSPAHRLLQNADAACRKVFHRGLTTSITRHHQNYTTFHFYRSTLLLVVAVPVLFLLHPKL